MVSSDSVSVTLPSELYGGQINALFDRMGLDARHGAEAGAWELRDSVARRPWAERALVEAKTLAAPWFRDDRFDLLTPPSDEVHPAMSRDELQEGHRTIDARLNSGSLAPFLYKIQLDILAAADADLIDASRTCHEKLTKLGFSDVQEAVFPCVTAHWLSIDARLYARSKLPAIVMRFEHDPVLLDQLRRGGADELTERSVFASGEALTGPGLLTDTYAGPLLACRAPDVWAVHGQRLGSTVIFSFGTAINGVSPIPVEPLQLLPRDAPIQWPEQRAAVAERACAEAVDWWAMRLNQMFTYLSDPTSYRDANDCYLPYHHQNWMMNAEELFSRVTSSLLSWRDQYAARILTFSALDLVSEAFLGGDMGALCDPARARKSLGDVKEAMPTSVAGVLLPNVEAAVSSLSNVADGFFIKEHRNAETVDFVKSDGQVESLTPDKAIAAVLRARRNATHGFGGKSGEPRVTRILAQHDGKLPPELVYLPFLYLLSVLCNPDRIRQRIERQCRAVNRT